MSWDREPGRGSYALPERERRFLVRDDPPSLRDTRTVEDRYLARGCGSKRVSAGDRSVWKLTQEVRVDEAGPADVRLTNAYLLLAEEHARLAVLPGRTLGKTRSACGSGFVVDVFSGGRLASLDEDAAAALLAEVRRLTG